MLVRRLLVGITLAVFVLNTACDYDARYAGLRLSESGDIEILYDPCGKDINIFRVALAISGKRDDPIWEIVSPNGTHQYEFTVGVTPSGFIETVHRISVIPDERLIVIIDSSRFDGESYPFEPDALRREVFYDVISHYYTREEISAGKLCD